MLDAWISGASTTVTSPAGIRPINLFSGTCADANTSNAERGDRIVSATACAGAAIRIGAEPPAIGPTLGDAATSATMASTPLDAEASIAPTPFKIPGGLTPATPAPAPNIATSSTGPVFSTNT